MIKGFKIRIYPNKIQREQIEKHIGCCRFIWNYMLNLQNENYKSGNTYISKYDMMKKITPMKKLEEYSWLNEVSINSLRIICMDLDKCFKSFFNKQNGYLKFKSKKKSKSVYPVRSDRFYFKNDKHMQVPILGIVKYKTDFEIPTRKHKFSNVRLSKEFDKYYISFGMECENQTQKLNDYSMGIDLGIKNLATVSCGDEILVFHNINKSSKMKKLNKRLRCVQKSISRKYEVNKFTKTNNIMEEEEKLRKIYKKISNIRNNYIHQISHELVQLLPKRVVMEDLNVRGMAKNKYLAKSIMEQEFNKFITYMKYKCENNNIEFVQANRIYPSSKMCSKCKEIKKDLTLNDRVYKCNCGLEIDRDLNAAINLMNYIV